MTMQSLKPAVLLGALLFTGMLAAQTPEPAQTPTAKPQVLPNPGTGGAASGQLPSPDPLTQEQQSAKVKADAEHISDLQTQSFARQLNLSPAQVQKLKPILADRQQAMRDAVAATPDSLVNRRTKMEQIRVDTQAKIEGILTPAQKAQFERLILAHRGGVSVRTSRPARAPMAPGAHVAPTRPTIQPAPGPSPAAPAVTPAAPAPPAAPTATPQSK
jgi:Spy/CpxP family protein refolding chaperone